MVTTMDRLRQQEGFTLIEMLSSIAISGFVLATAGLVVVAALRLSNTIGEKTGSAQTGRVTVEQIGQRVRSQTCLFPGEYRINGSGTPAAARGASIIHASASKLIFIGDLGDQGGTTGATGSVGFRPEVRWLEVSGAVGPTGSATLREGWTESTSARPYNFNISPQSSFDGFATTTGANTVTPVTRRAMADRVQTVPGFTRVFNYFNDAGAPVTESSGAVPLASLETITRIQVAFRVSGKRTDLVTNSEAAQFVNDFYVRTLTDRCEGS
jgi:prepilin-type N-terminal cleavage/methylation domain-containing protein